jgi:3-dehydroquinate synthase class II
MSLPADTNQDTGNTMSVTSLKPGNTVLVSLQAQARHTGIEIHEFIVEK